MSISASCNHADGGDFSTGIATTPDLLRPQRPTPGVSVLSRPVQRTQRTMSALLIAPDWRARSRPWRNSTSVGMLRMPKRAPSAGTASVSTFARRNCGSSCAAAAWNCGAMVRQGPHQGAQKSTSSGSSARPAWMSKLAASSATGCASNRRLPQRPQTGASVSRVRGTRLSVWQCGHATSRASLIGVSFQARHVGRTPVPRGPPCVVSMGHQQGWPDARPEHLHAAARPARRIDTGRCVIARA